MSLTLQKLFEDELRRRAVAFEIDPESGRHALEIDGVRKLISLENLQRDYATDGDAGRISQFVEAVLESFDVSDSVVSADNLFWCLEPNDYEAPAEFRVAVSDLVDRILIHLSDDGRLISWVTPEMLERLDLSESDAGDRAFDNLGQRLSEATLDVEEIDGVRLGMIGTTLPFKASLILAPNLKEVVGAALGWPLMAVTPDRDFVYLWAARHTDFVGRLGGVVAREYSQAAYPISTEVYEIDEGKIRAIGAFPVQE